MIWVVRVFSILTIIFFFVPGIYFVLNHNWADVVQCALCVALIMFWWQWLEEKRNDERIH